MGKVKSSLVSKPCLHFDADAARGVQLFRLERRSRRPLGGVPWHRPGLRVVCLGFVLACLPAGARSDQDASVPGAAGAQGTASSNPLHGAQSPDPIAHHVEERMAERRNTERQKTLVADTDKLLALAQQLKADVDKSNKDMLSVDVVKRAEQIEKLARSVKEKMRGS